MAMRTASPWWASLAFGVGLFFIFVSERLLSHKEGLRVALTGIGVILVLSITGARVWTTMATTGARRHVERTLLLCHVGTVLALVLYALTTKWGMELVGTESPRWSGALTVVWAILMVASTIPVLMIELGLGTALRTAFEVDATDAEDAGVEYYRVRDIGWSGLTVAFALSLLMVTCRVAKERNVQRDVSYFKTSAAGESTRNIVNSSSEVITAHLFFPQVNEVKEQVRSYFESLASTGKLQIAEHDRMVDAELAAKYKVTKDGVIVLARGKDDEAKKEKEKFFSIEVDTDLEKARKGQSKLRNLDREVNSNLMKIVREKRKAYVLAGHGELNDPDSVPPDLKGTTGQEWGTSAFKRRLGEINYELKDLGLMELAKDVPEDATLVIMLAPRVPLLPGELASLDRYLARGGRLMIALDPKADSTLGPLEGRLGVRMVPGTLTDEVAFYPTRGTVADRQWTITTQFSAHPSTTSLSRSVGKGLLLVEAGALEDVAFKQGMAAPKKTVTLRSMDTSFLDVNNNFAFDAGAEKKQRWNLGVAIEGAKDGDKDGFRALVYADAQLFADMKLIDRRTGAPISVLLSGPLLEESIRWLGGEEVFVGEVVSEDDKPIQHTKDQDAVWFTVTIVGAPLLVLTLGLFGTWYRRRRNKAAEVTP